MKIKLKIISALSAVVIISSIAFFSLPVYAADKDANQLYSEAYNATMNSLSVKSQKSINDARIAIKALYDTSASWAMGEFSKQVDFAQQPILVKIVDAINKAKLSGRQLDLEAARLSIDPELPAEWRNCYSSAIDNIEQKIKSAVSISNVSIVSNNCQVTVQGNISSGRGKNITIKVVDSVGNIDYVCQAVSGDNGIFIFKYNTNGKSGDKCAAYLSGEDINIPYQKTFIIS